MRVDSKKPFKIVYSLCKHAFLGYLIEPHVVQINQDGGFSLTYQRLFSNTAAEYAKVLDKDDLILIKLCEEIEQSQIIKRFYKKNIRPSEYFLNVFNEQLFAVIRPKMELKLKEILSLLKGKLFYSMSKEGWPVETQLTFAEHLTSILFHFRRTETELRYFPTLKYDGLRMEFMFKNAEVIVNEPACLILENTIYFFDQDVDGKKISPFLNKRFISIPRSAEQSYFKRFIGPLIEKHHVYAEGFDIKTQQFQGIPVIEFNSLDSGVNELNLEFKYGSYVFSESSNGKVSVKLEYDPELDNYTFYRIKRSVQWESGRIQFLKGLGIQKASALFNQFEIINKDEEVAPSLVSWLNDHIETLKENGYEVIQKKSDKQYLFGKMELNLDVKEDNDWFDIKAMVQFGDFTIPFINLRRHILNKEREFILPSGEIAIIPEQWFTQFINFFNFVEGEEFLRLKKQHIGLINDFRENKMAGVSMRRKMEKLIDFDVLEEIASPKHFNGSLRPYQKAGYNWFQFLKKYHFGGCLADDMGLGKTVQTLALLQKEKEDFLKEKRYPTSLIIMPTSLIYNWLSEAEKFAPTLQILNHTGTNRSKSSAAFAHYDVVISTYGIARIDESILNDFLFHYIILDESQNIKNVSSKSFKAINKLRSLHKLILSGTPVENSVADLWPQMAFINPGLLGGHSFFIKEFVVPIEKKKDEDAARRLQVLIKPFVLRRTKAQVAKELPEKTEKVFYCGMTEQQSDYYERVKAEYRNLMLKQLEDGSFKKSGIQVLQGLNKLRQLANHPKMIDAEYEDTSGKFENVIQTLENVLSRGHKVLIFSQFVRQMKIYAEYFDREKISYAYLDGATKNRQEVVNEFSDNESIKVFLISIKAGGVGLNLTEADYVFILDPWWNPAVEMQAIDRSHRIGQAKNVFIYKFITKDSVEEKILALQNRKRTIADSLIQIEESFVKSLTEEDISELLN